MICKETWHLRIRHIYFYHDLSWRRLQFQADSSRRDDGNSRVLQKCLRGINITVGDYELVNNPQLAGIALHDADEMLSRRYNEGPRGSFQQYKAFSDHLHTVTSKDEKTWNTVSMYGLTLSPNRRKWTNIPHNATQTTRQLPEDGKQRNNSEDSNEATRNDTVVPRKYVITRVLSHLNALHERNIR